MKNLIQSIQELYFQKITIRRYRRNSEIFGTMISYSYMGEPIGYKKYEKRNSRFIKILLSKNLKPWRYSDLSNFGWGRIPDPIQKFNSLEEKTQWLLENKIEEEIVKDDQKIKLAQKFFNR